MKKIDLLKALAQYDDDQEILVEAAAGGFDEPVVYITAVRAREGQEFMNPSSSEYLFDTTVGGLGAVVLGTAPGMMRWG